MANWRGGLRGGSRIDKLAGSADNIDVSVAPEIRIVAVVRLRVYAQSHRRDLQIHVMPRLTIGDSLPPTSPRGKKILDARETIILSPPVPGSKGN